MSKEIIIDYTNWRGVRSKRRIRPEGLFYGCTEHYERDQWLLMAWDYTKNDVRYFSLFSIHGFFPGDSIQSLPIIQRDNNNGG